MRIPTEHFTATPVFALSPSQPPQHRDMDEHSSPPPKPPPVEFSSLTVSGLMQQQQQAGPRSLMSAGVATREKKMSLPANAFNAFSLQSVGSAPNSPGVARKSTTATNSDRKNSEESDEPLPTISQSLNQQGPPPAKNDQVVMRRASKYATLPRK